MSEIGTQMRVILTNLFGLYEPIMTTEMVEGVPVEVVASGVAGVDWVWIAGVVLFGVILYSLFRLIGVLLKC